MKKKHGFTLLTFMLVIGLLLGACSSDKTGGPSKPGNTKAPKKVDTSKFPLAVKNDKDAVEGGTLNYALVSDTPFKGTLSATFSQGAPDAKVESFFDESLFSYNNDYEITNDGAATWELSDDKKQFTIKIKDNVNWSDGKPVTADDIIFTYEVLASKDYKGQRYAENPITLDIKGIDDFHKGKAKTISGLKKIDDKTVEISFNHVNPGILTGIWSTAMPKHIFKDIPVAKMEASDAVRKNPIGFGPFKITKIVKGESVEYTANENYWQGKPKLDKIILKVINPKVITKALQNGDVDIADYPTSQYKDNQNPKNYQYLATMDHYYSYIGFKLGHWDSKNDKVAMDPSLQVANKSLRQAMAYALDTKTVNERFYQGLRFDANTLIPPFFKRYHDDSIKGYTYDPAKAKKLLDDAGYKDVDNDGYREDPDGKPLVLNFASMSGSDVAEPIANYYIQNWKDIGIHVQLLDGRLHEFNSFYDRVGLEGKDDPKINIYAGAWDTGSDPDPTGLYANNVIFNFARWENSENEKLLKEGNSEQAVDPQYRKEAYNKWQQLMVDEVPVFPTAYAYGLTAVNNRVKGFTLEPNKYSTGYVWKDVQVTADKAEAAN